MPSTEICPTRSRNAEAQKKVIEGGIVQAQVATENTNFASWYHSWDELPTSAISGNIVKIDPLVQFTAAQVQQASAAAPNSWWIIGEEPNGIQSGDASHDGLLRSVTTISSGTFTVNVNKNQPNQSSFSANDRAVINNTASGGTDAYTRVIVNSVTDNGTYWIYTVTYSGGISSGTYAVGVRWGGWPGGGQTPGEYAQYYHTMSQAILTGSSGAKIIMGYFGQYYPPYLVRPWEYFDRVVTYWKSQNAWCAEPPMDAFHSNYFPFIDKDGNGVAASSNDDPSYTTQYVNFWRDQFFNGSVQAWLLNERFSLGTSQNYTPNGAGGFPSQEEATRYLQYTIGNYLNQKTYPWLLFQMNYSGYASNAGAGNLLQQACYTQPCNMTDYGEVFANAVYGNAGWEANSLSRWKICTATPNPFSVVSGGTTTPVASQYALKFTTTSSNSCTITSDKQLVSGNLGANVRLEIDYRVIQGNTDSRFYVNFFDANDIGLGSTNQCAITTGVTSGWQHASCTFPSSAYQNAASLELVVNVVPSGGGTKEFQFDNASVIVLP